jgi:hypothetical protein
MTIKPLTVTSNWKTTWMKSHHTYGGKTESTPSLSFRRAWDRNEPYTIIREINRQKIDACCLRVNKKLFDDANNLLYSRNTFSFRMVKNYRKESPPTCYDGATEHRPHPDKPGFEHVTGGYNHPLFSDAISSIINQVGVQELDGWVYYDHFLRFLYTIGPRNAALIKTLEFKGIAEIHDCSDNNRECWRDCAQDLANSLKIYAPFINALCPAVTKIIIRSEKDYRFNAANATNFSNIIPMTPEQALRPCIDNHLRSITSLNELVVVDESGDDIYWAQDTIDWIAQRAVERKARELAEYMQRHAEEAAAQFAQPQPPQVHCGFCGEGHVWAECWNLCSVCGSFGHFCQREEEIVAASEH